MRPAHQCNERHIGERLHQLHIGQPAERVVHRLAHIRIRMHREHDFNVGPRGNIPQRRTDAVEVRSEALAPVRRDEDEFFL